MIDFSTLQSRDCPVCKTSAESGRSFLERNIDPTKLNAFSFSSRKSPEYMRFRLVLCPNCDVVYANESILETQTDIAYHQAAYDSKEEARHAAETYAAALIETAAMMADRRGVLDIGTGTGVFLQCISRLGFTDLIGIEPSHAALEAADAEIKPNLRKGPFSADDFSPGSFSLITCFMTLEHVYAPAALVEACRSLLKPGGYMAVVVHDWRAWNNRILGAKSPIIDIEHLQLFSRKSISELFLKAGYTNVICHGIRNKYTLDYWNRLLPLPALMKQALSFALSWSGMGRLKLPMNVGNLFVLARKA